MLPTPVFWPGEFCIVHGSQRVGHDGATFSSFHVNISAALYKDNVGNTCNLKFSSHYINKNQF